MPDLSQTYEAKQLAATAALARKIRTVYESGIQEVTALLSTVKYKGQLFRLADYPILAKKVEAVSAKMQKSIYALSLNGIKESWGIANQKNNILVDQRLKGKKVSKSVKQILYDPNKGALNSFITRKEKGLNLSDRVWKAIGPLRNELEQSLGIAIGQGQSAKQTATEVKKYLNEPDKLFRRVRGEDGKLHLSPAARAYHPGKGVYRSSYKNALRLTRTENNIAYRSSDHERWQNMPFVTGFEVKLSKSHPKYDICDSMVGKYPKDFKFVGWHPQCLCYKTPILNSDEDFEKMEDAVLAGEPIPSAAGQVIQTPAGFRDWVKDNKDRVSGWKNKPYWMRDNPDYINSFRAVPKPVVPVIPKVPKPAAPVPPAPVSNTLKDQILAKSKQNIAEIKKVYDFPDELLEHFSEEIDIQFGSPTGGSFFDPAHKKMVIADSTTRAENSEFYKKTLVRHELGHAIHNDKKIIYWDKANYKTEVSPEFAKHFKSLQAKIRGKQNEIETAFRKEYTPASIAGDDDAREQLMVIWDIVGSLSRGKYGGGHAKSYFKQAGKPEAEIFAHSTSLLKVKNRFESLTPEIKSVIDEMKSWISKIL